MSTEAITFWQGIAKLPEPAQQSFWDAGQALSAHLGEPPQPRRLTLDTRQPPPGMPWWERILFYVGQGQYNQAVAQAAAAEATIEGAQWLWGALQGDFNKNPTTGQVIVGGIISLLPFVDQACDIRDLVANCITLSDEQARQDEENWIALALTCVGFVPLYGSAVKTVAKVAVKESTHLIDLVKVMESFESRFRQWRVGVPWGRSPQDWLKRYDWAAELQQAAVKAGQAFVSAAQKAQAAARYALGSVRDRLNALVKLFEEIAQKIESKLAALAARIKARVAELLPLRRQETGNYGATPGERPNVHRQNETQPPKEPPRRPPAAPSAKVPCFHPFNNKNFKRMTPEQQRAYLRDMAKQLERQQEEINKLSAIEYKAARDTFEKVGRNPLAEDLQSNYRKKFERDLQTRIFDSLERSQPQMLDAEREALAASKAKELMTKLAALHEPDMVAGGWMSPDPKAMGRADVNSAIGGSWKQSGRVESMDTAADEAIRSGRGDQPMNVKLEVCRGKGLR